MTRRIPPEQLSLFRVTAKERAALLKQCACDDPLTARSIHMRTDIPQSRVDELLPMVATRTETAGGALWTVYPGVEDARDLPP